MWMHFLKRTGVKYCRYDLEMYDASQHYGSRRSVSATKPDSVSVP